MKHFLWTFVRCAICILLLGQAVVPAAGVQPASPAGTGNQAAGRPDAFTPLETGSLPLSLHYVRSFGETGIPYPPSGQDAYLNNPAGLTVGPTNDVYITENGGRRLRSFDPSGSSRFIVGTAGQDKEFLNPQDVTFHEDFLWVADWNRLLVYSTSGVLQQEINNIDNTVRPDRPNYIDCARGVSFDSSGRLFVAQTCGSNNAAVFTVNGTLPDLTLTLQGVIEGGFKDPQAIQVADLNGDATEEVYVSGNDQLLRCMESGGIWSCESFGDKMQPRGMGLNPDDPSRLYVVRNDWNGPAVMSCGQDGKCETFITNTTERILYDPVDVAFDTEGNAFISDRGDSTIKMFTTPTSQSVFAGTQGVPYVTPSSPDPDYFYNYPGGVAVGPDYSVLILEEGGQRLTKFTDNGAFTWSYGVPGVPGNDSQHINWALGNPAVDAAMRIYIPDRNNNRVSILDANGNQLGYIGNQNDWRYQFNSPSGVAIGPNGNIYVVDGDAHNVQIYDSARFFQSSIGVKWEWGMDDAHFNRPSAIAVKDDLTVFVADANNARVQKCTRLSASATAWTCSTFAGVSGDPYWDNDHYNSPSSVAWDNLNGRLYVSDEWQNRVMAYDGSGKLLATLADDWGTSNAQLKRPTGLAVDNVGNLYVADHDNHRVQKFIPAVSQMEFAGQVVGTLRKLARVGNTLYASNGPRLDVFNLADPQNPAFVGESDLLPREITGLAVSGGYAYVTLGDYGFGVLDLSTPTRPTIVSSLPLINPTDVAVMGNRAYVTTYCCGWNWSSPRMFVIDVTVKTNLKVVNAIEWPGKDAPKELVDVAVSGSGDGQFAYLAARNSGVIKVSVDGVTPSIPPTETGRFSPPDVNSSGVALSADASLAYVVDQNFGLWIINTSNMDPSGLGSVQTVHQPWQDGDWRPANISRDGNTLYLPGYGEGMGVVDVTNPAAPALVIHRVINGSMVDALGAGNLVYVTNEDQGLKTIELVLTPSPEFNILDTALRPAGSAGYTLTRGNLTYETTWVGGFRILDTSKPGSPVELSASCLDTTANFVAVLSPQPGNATYAYLVTGRPGEDLLRVMDVTDPKAPVIAGQTSNLKGQLNAVEVRQAASGDPVYAFIPSSGWWDNQFYNGALHVLDVTNPAAIVEPGGVTAEVIGGNVNGIVLYGNYLLVADGLITDKSGNKAPDSGGLHVFDISNPPDPVEVRYVRGFDAAGIAIQGNRLYLTKWGEGLSIWDISNIDPAVWHEIGSIKVSRDSYARPAVATIAGRTYVTVGRGSMGMGMLDVTDPGNIQVVEETGRLAGWGWSPNVAGHYTFFSSPGGGLYTFWAVPAAEGIIPAGGGSLGPAADGAVYTFASGALMRDLRLRHTPVMEANVPAPGGNRVGIGHAFVVSATDAANDRPLAGLAGGQTYTLEVNYTPQELGGLSETSLGLYYWDGAAWVKEPTTPDLAAHRLTAHPNHFSIWMVQGSYNAFIAAILR